MNAVSTITENSNDIPTWATASRERVAHEAAAFTARHAATPAQARLLEVALCGLRAINYERSQTFVMSVHLPLAVYDGIRGDEEAAYPLAVALALLELGIDTHDNLADRELGAHWRGHSPEVVMLAASGLLCTLPQLAIAELESPPHVRAELQRALAAGLCRIGAGQQTDIELMRSDAPSVEAVLDSVAGKTGERRALFAELAARFAGAPQQVIEACRRFAQSLGVARQIASDVADILVAPHSRDLAAGARTLPIALYLEQLVGSQRAEFLELLDFARGDAPTRYRVRQRLLDSSVLRQCAFAINLYHQRALRALDSADLNERGRSRLEAMARNVVMD